MATPRACVTSIVICAFVVLVLVASHAAGETVRIWKVGSPHRGDTPAASLPAALQREAAARGIELAIDVFPAAGFAQTFSDAVARSAAPDVLVFDNFGVMDGITTALGTFPGIGSDPAIRRDLIQVTGTLDALLAPARGWAFLFAFSPNHNAARRLALKAPDCPSGSGPQSSGDLAETGRAIATAYLEQNDVALQRYADPDRLSTGRLREETLSVGAARSCGVWGNQKLAVVSVVASYDAGGAIGRTLVTLVLRNVWSQWRVLVAARDPVSTSTFIKEVVSLPADTMVSGRQIYARPLPATLMFPAPDQAPRPTAGERFGEFEWESSPSEVVAEIVEFAYGDDARLFVTRPSGPGSRGRISAGQLWTTKSLWSWRVWSITRTGDLSLSDARTFPH